MRIRHLTALLALVTMMVWSTIETNASPSNAPPTLNANSQVEQTSESISQSARQQIAPGLIYERLEIDPLAIAHIIRADTTCDTIKIAPYLGDSTEQTSSVAEKLGALVAVNAGFFNLSDGESTSYVVVDGKSLCEPKHNAALVNNTGLKPFLTRIFNRAELRFFKDKNGKLKLKIQPHADSVPRGLSLVHSVQAGPQLLPDFTARQEAFIRRAPGAAKDADSIGTAVRAARTAFGITDDGTAILVCVQGKRTKEFAEGVSLPNLADFMRRLGCTSALNFDGGTSTTMVVKFPQGPDSRLTTVVSSSPERKVKSFVYIAPVQ